MSANIGSQGTGYSKDEKKGHTLAGIRRPVKHVRPRKCFIHKLPSELLCEIFMICGDPNPMTDYPRDYLMHSHDGPQFRYRFSRMVVTLGYVCSRWLHATRGCPPLWTLVDVAFPQPRDVVALRLCLECSAGLPLALQICETEKTPKDMDVCRSFMRLVAAHPHRWAEISIGLDLAYDILDPLLALPSGAFASLAKTSVHLLGRDEPFGCFPDFSLMKLFYSSPALRTVEWWCDPYDKPHITSAPMDQLTHIGLKYFRPEHLFDLLRSCPRLEVLQVSLQPSMQTLASRIPESEWLPAGAPAITLLYLRAMALCGLVDWSRLYDCLIVPSLRRLELNQSGVQASAIEGMLQRSASQLQLLTLFRPFKGWMDKIEKLLHSPAMASLRIVRYEIYVNTARRPDWETGDISPFIPLQVDVYTARSLIAEEAYKRLS
ncbi:hypothetical protein GGG16DRAFT_105181 [Schizophyllum commune]